MFSPLYVSFRVNILVEKNVLTIICQFSRKSIGGEKCSHHYMLVFK